MILIPRVLRCGLQLWILNLLLFFPLTAHALSPETQRLANEGLDLLYNDRFDAAIDTFRRMHATEPNTFIGDFYLCFSYELYMDEYKTTMYDSVFNILANRAITIGDSLVAIKPTAETYLYLGGAYGIRGTRKGQFGDWWGAFKDGKHAYDLLNKCVALDPGQIDAYYGIGLYHFWKSHKLRLIAWLPFISDQREEGRNQLRKAMLEGRLARVPSRSALFRIYMEEQEYAQVIRLAQEFGKLYPDDVFYRWFLGFALARLGRWEETLTCFIEVDALLKQRPHGREADVISMFCHAQALYELKGPNQEALQLVRSIKDMASQVDTRLFYYADYLKEADVLEKKMAGKAMR